MKIMKIEVNKIRCLNCGDILESKYEGDRNMCSCGECIIDGGKTVLIRKWNQTKRANEAFEELSMMEGQVGKLIGDREEIRRKFGV